ncbi:hypothetical protein OC842_002238 [Tilletia horrida]|uniref:Uncharacterized protein n=1 Tax=Tilletia horrida TaxID=155126 RepID=A0AAN6GG96_9BASI|nr:hypothetical protein OC842_002238 [Tilletia horrida]
MAAAAAAAGADSSKKNSGAADADELLRQAEQHFPENPFADEVAAAQSHGQAQDQPQSQGQGQDQGEGHGHGQAQGQSQGQSTQKAAAIGDKNPFRALLGANHTGSSASTQHSGVFDLSALDAQLPATQHKTGSGNGPSSAAAATGDAASASTYAPPPPPQLPPSLATPTADPETSSIASSASHSMSTHVRAASSPSSAGVPSAPTSSYAPPTGPPPEHSTSHATPAASSYAPPSGPPPPSSSHTQSHQRVASSPASGSSSQPAPPAYVPTNVPTPGAPLLRKGKLLVYPRGLAPCPKCRNTGYKYDDPTHPCRGCWSRYGETVTSLLARHGSFDRVPGVLQAPLPNFQPHGRHPHHGSQSVAGYPGAGAMASRNSYRYMDNAYDPGFGHGMHTPTMPAWLRNSQDSAPLGPSSSFRPPAGPPPAPPARPPVNRTEEARQAEARTGATQRQSSTGGGEPTGDEGVSAEGEVPPSYDEAVAAAAEGRTLEPQHVPPPTHHSARPGRTSAPPASSSSAAAHAAPPRPSGLYSGPGPASPYAPPPGPPHQHHHHPHHYPAQPMHGPPAVGPPEAPYGMAPVPNVHYVDSRRRPPPGAIVVRPGDPRIGGRLCYNCGGDGMVSAP